jgi:hypothetical protein
MFSMWAKVSGCMGKSESESEREREREREGEREGESERENEGEREKAGRQSVPEGKMATKNRRGRKKEFGVRAVTDGEINRVFRSVGLYRQRPRSTSV